MYKNDVQMESKRRAFLLLIIIIIIIIWAGDRFQTLSKFVFLLGF